MDELGKRRLHKDSFARLSDCRAVRIRRGHMQLYDYIAGQKTSWGIVYVPQVASVWGFLSRKQTEEGASTTETGDLSG